MAPGPCTGDFPAENLPVATVEPSELTVAIGQSATYTVTAPELTTLNYQWYRSNQDGSLQPISGATGSAFTLVNAQQGDNGTTFRAYVDGGYASGRLVMFSSEGRLTVR